MLFIFKSTYSSPNPKSWSAIDFFSEKGGLVRKLMEDWILPASMMWVVHNQTSDQHAPAPGMKTYEL